MLISDSVIKLGRHYLTYPESFACTNGVMEHPAGTPVGNFDTHMSAWCGRVFGVREVPDEYKTIAETLTALGTATATLSHKDDVVSLVIATAEGELFRGPIFYGRDDHAWFGVGIRVGCQTALKRKLSA